MKLHLGCGKKILSGYINIDGANQRADTILELDKALPFDDNSVSEILAIHLFEHFYPKDAPRILSDFYRVLKPRGRLILEMPDIYKSAKNLIAEIDAGNVPSDKWAMWPMYGDNPNQTEYDCHKWGWTFLTLSPILQAAGFTDVMEHDPQYHGRKTNRDFRIEAVK